MTLTDKQTERGVTGYPSIDKPWLKLYDNEIIQTPLPQCTLYEYVKKRNEDNMSHVAIEYYGCRLTYKQLFEKTEVVANSLLRMGVTKGSIVTAIMFNQPESIYLLLALNKIGAVANFLFCGSSLKEIRAQLEATNSKIVFTLDFFTGEIEKLMQ